MTMQDDSTTQTPTPEPEGAAVELVSNRWLAALAKTAEDKEHAAALVMLDDLRAALAYIEEIEGNYGVEMARADQAELDFAEFRKHAWAEQEKLRTTIREAIAEARTLDSNTDPLVDTILAPALSSANMKMTDALLEPSSLGGSKPVGA